MSEYFNLPLFEQLLPILIPPVVVFLMKVFDRMPKWVIPTLIVPGLGVAGQWMSTMLSSGDLDPIKGLIYGALAILIREVSNKLKKAGTAIKNGERVPRLGDGSKRFRR